MSTRHVYKHILLKILPKRPRVALAMLILPMGFSCHRAKRTCGYSQRVNPE